LKLRNLPQETRTLLHNSNEGHHLSGKMEKPEASFITNLALSSLDLDGVSNCPPQEIVKQILSG